MHIYNTTYLVAEKQYDEWLKWLKEKHIPMMLATGFFFNPQIAKVLSADNDQEGASMSVQFLVHDFNTLQEWDEKNADTLLDELAQRFGTDVLSFSTVLEVVN